MDKLEEAIELLKDINIAWDYNDTSSHGKLLSLLRSHQEEYEKLKGERDKFKKALITHSLKCKDIQAFLELSDEYKSASLDDVLRLRKENERLREALKAAKEKLLI